MTASITPTIFSSKSSFGIVPSAQIGNVAWNDDGQCLFLTKKGATVMTPWLLSSLPSPPTLAGLSSGLDGGDTGKGKGDEGDEEADDPDEDMDKPDEDGSGAKEAPEISRPDQGEVKWWSNLVEVGGLRDKRYGWGGVDASNWYMRNEEITARQAVWSPSGLSDIGGCLLAMLSSAGQLSVYTPRSDPTRVQWDEIADITYLTKGTFLPPIPRGEKPSLSQVKEMQATYIAWSPAINHDPVSGIDGSLLAVADRRCGISLWSYGPDRRFRRLARLKVGEVWATQLTWSEWTMAWNNAFESRLAYTTTDGAVGAIVIRRGTETSSSGQMGFGCQVGEASVVDIGDKRNVACLQWIDDVLMWSKPGSVHFSSNAQRKPTWSGTRTIRLERVGSWAGCNGMTSCVGVHRFSSSSIVIVLATLELHIIHDVLTSPTSAPLHESLIAALAARQAVLDHVHGDYLKLNRFRLGPTPVERFTAYTSAWAGLGRQGLGFVNFEIINFHNLDTANEGKRLMALVALDISDSLPGQHRPPMEAFRDILDNPVNPLFQSSSRQLLPQVIRFMSVPLDTHAVSELLDMVSPDDDDDELPAPSEAHPDEKDLRQALFIREDLNGIRLKYALALWFARVSPARKADFQKMANRLLKFIVAANLIVAARYVFKGLDSVKAGSRDDRYVQLLADRSRSIDLSLDSMPGRVSMPDTEGETSDKCPACQQPVDMGDTSGLAKCTNGHRWLTGFLITNARYRTCTTCPAVALLPGRIATPPTAVDDKGRSKDYERYLRPIASGEALVQAALGSCTSCIICGGRWYRAS